MFCHQVASWSQQKQHFNGKVITSMGVQMNCKRTSSTVFLNTAFFQNCTSSPRLFQIMDKQESNYRVEAFLLYYSSPQLSLCNGTPQCVDFDYYYSSNVIDQHYNSLVLLTEVPTHTSYFELQRIQLLSVVLYILPRLFGISLLFFLALPATAGKYGEYKYSLSKNQLFT